MKIFKTITSFFTKKLKIGYLESRESKEIIIKFASLKYWTPELIEWIGKGEDSVKLSVASDLLNDYIWVDWMPGKPDWYNNGKDDSKHPEYSERLYFVCAVIDICRKKAERITPELHTYISLTDYSDRYRDTPPKQTGT